MVLNHVPLLRPDISRTCAPGLQKVSEEASTRPLGERCPQLRLLSTRKDLLPKLQPRSPGSQAPFAQMEGARLPPQTWACSSASLLDHFKTRCHGLRRR